MIAKRAVLTILLAAGMFTLTVFATAQTKDSFVGTWHLDVAKSKYSPGPVPKSQTSTYTAVGSGYKIAVRIEPVSGPVQEYSFTTTLDGKDAPVTGNNPNADMVAVKRIDANTIEIVNKKAGKVTTTTRSVVSTDGKTRTNTTTGTDGQGRTVNNISVFERR